MKQVYIFTSNWVIDDEPGDVVKAFDSYEKAKKFFDEDKENVIRDISYAVSDYVTEEDEKNFTVYEDGNYNGNHICNKIHILDEE